MVLFDSRSECLGGHFSKSKPSYREGKNQQKLQMENQIK